MVFGSWATKMGQNGWFVHCAICGCLIGDFSGKPDTYDSDHMIVSSPKCFKDLNKCVADGYQSKE